MTTTAKKTRSTSKRPKTKKPEPISIRPFTVTSNGYRFRFHPEDVGFSVECLSLPEAISQGDTFEEALANAHDAVALATECLADIAKEEGKTAKKKPESRKGKK